MNKKFIFIVLILAFAINAHAETLDTPSITALLVNAKTIAVGDTLSVSWNRTGTFDPKDSYFVFLKDKSKQLLGSHDPVQDINFTSIAFWQPTLSYPTMSFSVPIVAPGTHYVEVDFVNPSGGLITTATSNAFTISPLMITIGASNTNPAPTLINTSDRQWAIQVLSILDKISVLLRELSQLGVK